MLHPDYSYQFLRNADLKICQEFDINCVVYRKGAIAKARDTLVEQFKNEKVPGLTWLKEKINYRSSDDESNVELTPQKS